MSPDEANKKDVLEVQKLQAEVANLRRWWAAPVIQVAPTALLAIGTIYVATKSGFLDARRETLLAQNERLTNQKMLLEASEEKTRERIRASEEQLAAVKAELGKYEDEQRVIQSIRKGCGKIEYNSFTDSYDVDLYPGAPYPIRGDETDLEKQKIARFRAEDIERFRSLLPNLRDIRKLQRLTISERPLRKSDLAELAGIKKLMWLVLDGTDATAELLEQLPTLPELIFLEIKTHGKSPSERLGISTVVKKLRSERLPRLYSLKVDETEFKFPSAE